MNDNHPNHPANAKEFEPAFGYICPNQFAQIEEHISGLDEQMSADDALARARELAELHRMDVKVELSEEDGFDTQTRTIKGGF